MHKLKLNVEDLEVEVFSTEESSEAGSGTVEAHQVGTRWWSGCPVHTCYC